MNHLQDVASWTNRFQIAHRAKSKDMLHSAEVAIIRSGNERAVKHFKHSWIIQRGIRHSNFDLAMLNDIWLAWGFQINFMYETVL
jgi:hypothetical protein